MKRDKLFKTGFLLVLVSLLLLVVMQVQSQRHLDRLQNPMVIGWMFGQGNEFAGEQVWGYTGTADTLVITGLDTTCVVFLTAKTTDLENLYYDIHAAGDTLFVTSDSSGTADTDKYSYIIVRNAYGATD